MVEFQEDSNYVTNQVMEVRDDLAGNLTQFTKRKNQIATFQYNALNRRMQATDADATTTFTYDPKPPGDQRPKGPKKPKAPTIPGAAAISCKTLGRGTMAELEIKDIRANILDYARYISKRLIA